MNEEAYPIPSDTEMEEQVIASMLAEPETIGEVAGFLLPEHLYNPEYRKLYPVIIENWEKDASSVNLIDMVPAMQKIGVDSNRITNVAISMPTHWDIQKRAERLIQLATLRSAMKVGHQLITNGHGWHMMDQEEIQKAVTDAQTALEGIGSSTVRQTMHLVRNVVMDYVEKIGERMNSTEDQSVLGGIPTGLRDLDKLLKGCAPTELIILAARPSMGKTALMNQFVLNMSGTSPGAIPIFSLEMSAEKLVARMLANLGNLSDLEGRVLTDDEYLKLTMAAAELAKRSILIDDEAGQTVAQIKAKVRRLQQTTEISAIAIDYLQFIEPPNRAMPRAEAVSHNTKALKNLAKELGVPVIALAQVGRQVEQRADKRPMMSDLRESGEIEQTADKIMFLYRDDYYNKDSEKKNVVEVDVAKNRDGATGKAELAFLKEYGKFVDLAVNVNEPEQITCI